MTKIVSFILIVSQSLALANIPSGTVSIDVHSLAHEDETLAKAFPILKKKLDRFLQGIEGNPFTLANTPPSPLPNQEFEGLIKIANLKEIKASLTNLEQLYSSRQMEAFKSELGHFLKKHPLTSLMGVEKQKTLFLQAAQWISEGNFSKGKQAFKEAKELHPTGNLPFLLDWEAETTSPEIVKMLEWKKQIETENLKQATVEFLIQPENSNLLINGFEIETKTPVRLVGNRNYLVEVSHPQYQTKTAQLQLKNVSKQTFSIALKRVSNKVEEKKPSIFVDTNGKEINFYLFHPNKGIQPAHMTAKLAVQDLIEQPMQTDLNLNQQAFVNFFSEDVKTANLDLPSAPMNSIAGATPSTSWYQDWKWWGAIGVVSGIALITVLSRNSHEDPVKVGQINISF